MRRKAWNLSTEELAKLAADHTVSEIARLTGFSNTTVDRQLSTSGLMAQKFRSKYAGLSNKIEILDCPKHGSVEFRQNKRNGNVEGYVCAECSRDASKRKRLRARLALIQEYGGKCTRCGYDECIGVLQFHHRDPSSKRFGIGSYTGIKSSKELRDEADKCDLLCANCHAQAHYELRNIAEYMY